MPHVVKPKPISQPTPPSACLNEFSNDINTTVARARARAAPPPFLKFFGAALCDFRRLFQAEDCSEAKSLSRSDWSFSTSVRCSDAILTTFSRSRSCFVKSETITDLNLLHNAVSFSFKLKLSPDTIFHVGHHLANIFFNLKS
jgi:hypothetical protein